MQPETEPGFQENNLNLDDLPLRDSLDGLLSKGVPVVLAIDGRAASGKSSLTEKLARDYPARVIHMDDFYLPIELRTVERLAEPGGNLHYERFMTDVLPGLRKQEGFSYQAFDCAGMNVGEWRNLFLAQLTIVEGAYAMHPKLDAYYDLALFLSCAPETQLARIKKRNPAKFEQFRKHWIPMEEAYFQAFGIPELADFIIQT